METPHTHTIEHLEPAHLERIANALREEHGIKTGETSIPHAGTATFTRRSLPELQERETIKAEFRHDPKARTLEYRITHKPETLGHEKIGEAIRRAVDAARK